MSEARPPVAAGTVLVVEDDATLLDAVAYNLERDGHQVTTATDGVNGLWISRLIRRADAVAQKFSLK